MGADVRAIEKRHAKLYTVLLRQGQQTLPDPQSRPADESLGRHPPGPQIRGTERHLAPFSCRQMIASTVRLRCSGGFLVWERHASTIGSSTDQCASLSMPSPPSNEKRSRANSVQTLTDPNCSSTPASLPTYASSRPAPVAVGFSYRALLQLGLFDEVPDQGPEGLMLWVPRYPS